MTDTSAQNSAAPSILLLDDEEMVPDNLDSVSRMVDFVNRKQAAA